MLKCLIIKASETPSALVRKNTERNCVCVPESVSCLFISGPDLTLRKNERKAKSLPSLVRRYIIKIKEGEAGKSKCNCFYLPNEDPVGVSQTNMSRVYSKWSLELEKGRMDVLEDVSPLIPKASLVLTPRYFNPSGRSHKWSQVKLMWDVAPFYQVTY